MLRLALDPIWGVRLPYITLFPAIMVSAWLGGLWPGIITTALCGAAAEYFWIEPSGSWVVTQKSELLGLLLYFVIGVVISVLNEAWRRGTVALAESEQRLSVTLSSIGDGVVTTDVQGRVVRLNAVAEALTGWAEHDAVGRRLEEIFVIINEETRRPTDNPIGTVLRDNVIVGLANHTMLISKEGREIPIDDSAAPIRTADGVVTGVVLVFRDVTERRRVEREQARLLEREQAALSSVRQSEDRLRVTIEGIGDAVIATDDHARITLLNPVAQALTGWSPADAVGRPLHDVFVIINEETRQSAANPVDRVLREGIITGLANHTILVSKNGRELPIDDSAAPVRADDGRIVGAVVVFRDISERRRVEREREARERTASELAAIVESSNDAIIGKNFENNIATWNRAAEHMFGYSASEAIGQSIRLIVPDDRWSEEEEILRRIRRGEKIDHVETVRSRKGGTLIPVSLTISPIRDATGAVVGASKTARDITERRRAEREQVAALDRSRRLAEVAEALSQVLPLDEIAKTVLTHATAALDAQAGTLRLLSDDGSTLDLLSEIGFQGTVSQRYQSLPLTPGVVPVVDAVRTREPVILESRAAWEAHYPNFVPLLNTVRAGFAVPLIFEDRRVGGFLLTFDAERTFGDDEQRFLLTLARLCGHAIERHRLLNAEREARLEAERTAQQLRTALEAGRMGAWEYTIATGAVKWSPGLEAIHGFATGSFPGTFEAFRAEIYPADRDRVLEAISAAVDQRRDHHVEYRIVRADGAVRWVEGRGQLYCDKNGQPERLVGVCLDITDRKAAEEMQRRAREPAIFLSEASARLANSLDYEETLRTIARLAVPTVADWCAVDMVDDAGKPRRLAIAHVDPTKIELARSLEERYPEDPQSPYGVYQVLRTGAPTMMTDIPDALLVESARDQEHLRILREVGLRSYMCVPMNVAGRTLGVLTFVTEAERRYSEADLRFAEQLAERAALGITNARLYEDARRLAQERAEVLTREQMARAELERAGRLKDEFLAVLSHELRTPLNAVLGYAHLLDSGVLPPERARHALDAIQRNAHAQARLVESLLDLSRVMAGKLELNLEELDLAAIVNAAVDALAPGAEEKGMAIDAVVPSRSIVADGGRLQQVFWNLLSNAIKFSDRGGRVTIRCTEEDAYVRVQVTDDGHGIGADFLPYVFDRFSQGDGQSRRSRTGLGLGLALVREMVQAHGGTVAAESPGEGRGSTFSVTLPLSIGSFPPRAKRTRTPDADTPESFPPIEILIVDDEGDVRDLLALLVESRGARARTVSSASEALDAISQDRPDVLLADLRMPDEDGYSLIQKVRAREREQQEERLPAIAVTAYASPRDRDQAIAAGFDAHVAKPVEAADLARAVASVARGVSPKNETV
jgi:PAS domain S-box-containing protein